MVKLPRTRRARFACIAALAVLWLTGTSRMLAAADSRATVISSSHISSSTPGTASATTRALNAAPPQSPAAEQAEATAKEESHDSLWPPFWKGVNLAILVAILVYYLRSPFAGYLQRRGESIRKDLIDAAAVRAEGDARLQRVRAELAELPRELEALRKRGEEDLAAEKIRLAEATASTRTRLLAQTRREIDAQFRLARRSLLEHTAALTADLAERRLRRDITADDQSRLIDRYASEVRQ